LIAKHIGYFIRNELIVFAAIYMLLVAS